MARILVDIDDVLFPFIDSLRDHLVLHRVKLREDLPDPTSWEFSEQWGVSHEELWAKANFAIGMRLFLRADPYPGAAEALQELKTLGHTIHLATARFGGPTGLLHQDTAIWLEDNCIPFDSLSFTSDKTIINADYAIDDRVKNYKELEQQAVVVFLLDRPWNQDKDGYENRRVYSLAEFVEFVKKAERKTVTVG